MNLFKKAIIGLPEPGADDETGAEAGPGGVAAGSARGGRTRRPPRRKATGAAAADVEERVQAAWSRLTPLQPDLSRLRRNRIVAAERMAPEHVSFDMLRTQLLQTMQGAGMRTVAITSPEPGCGKSSTSLNLAFSFARRRHGRTVLLELDLRRPVFARILGAEPPRHVAELMAGEATPEEALVRVGEGLAIGFADGPTPNSAELLQDDDAAAALERIFDALDPDLVICDLPPLLVADDAAAFLAHADCAMLIAAANETKLQDIERCETQMTALTEVLGVVVNKCEFAPREYQRYAGYY